MILHHLVFEKMGDDARPFVKQFKDEFGTRGISYLGWLVTHVPLKEDSPGEEVYGAPIGTVESDVYINGKHYTLLLNDEEPDLFVMVIESRTVPDRSERV